MLTRIFQCQCKSVSFLSFHLACWSFFKRLAKLAWITLGTCMSKLSFTHHLQGSNQLLHRSEHHSDFDYGTSLKCVMHTQTRMSTNMHVSKLLRYKGIKPPEHETRNTEVSSQWGWIINTCMQSRFMPISNIFPFLASGGLMPLPLCGTCSSCAALLFLYLTHPCCAIYLSVTHNTGAKGMCNIHNVTMYKGGSTGIMHNVQGYQTLDVKKQTTRADAHGASPEWNVTHRSNNYQYT